jgi:gephyrin
VKIEKQCSVGQDIRPIGSDVSVGQQVLAKGTFLRPAEIGILATVGTHEVEVFPAPEVAVLSTGDELVEPDSRILQPGQIRDSNRLMLLSALRENSCPVIDLGISSDEHKILESRIMEGLGKADILITSGGVSMGELDLIKPLLEKLGTVHFGRVLMKPGKPLTFASVHYQGKQRLVFGLPGNPVSSLVTFTLFVIPSLRKICGFENPHHKVIQAKTTSPMKLDTTRPEYHRATVHWDLEQQCYCATSTGRQISSRLLSMVSANAFLLVPQGTGSIETGSMVSALIVGP